VFKATTAVAKEVEIRLGLDPRASHRLTRQPWPPARPIERGSPWRRPPARNLNTDLTGALHLLGGWESVYELEDINN